MGYPNWKRLFRDPVLRMARPSDEFEDGVIRKQDLSRFAEEVSDDLGDDLDAVLLALEITDDLIPVKHVMTPVFDEFFRSIAMADEGERGEQELDTRVLRYDLLGKRDEKQPLQYRDEM